MRSEVRILQLSDAETWQREQQGGQRPSQDWHYASALALDGVAPALAVVRAGEGALSFCFFERAVSGAADVATVLGLSGASTQGDPTGAWLAWREFARERGWVAGYLQLAHDAVPPAESEAREFDRVRAGNAVFLLDLRVEDPLRQASEIVRRKIRRAARLGVAAEDERELLGDFLVEWYPRSMERLGAGPACRHAPETLRAFASLPQAVVLGASLAGRIESVSVFLRQGERAEFLCNGCTPEGRELSAWLLAEGIARLRALGVREFNLGGGVARGDGLYDFKQRFHGREVPLRALQQVYDSERYRRLCREAGVEPEAESGYFPAYRSSMSSRSRAAG